MISPRSEERKDWQFLDRSLQANIEDMLVLVVEVHFECGYPFFSFLFEKKVGLSGGWIECTCNL